MRKRMWILLMLFMMMTYGCGKQEQPKEMHEDGKIQIQVPTMNPTEAPLETVSPTEQPAEGAEPEKPSIEEEGSILDHIKMDLPEEYTRLIDEKNKVITIAREGRKVARMVLHEDYRGKQDAVNMMEGLLGLYGYVKAARTTSKESYQCTKVTMETGISREDIQSGKLFSGNEAVVYLYYQNKVPTKVLTLEVSDLDEEAAMERISATIQLIE